ncbi:MAG: hypothetical protein MUO17_05945 [Dehalococcoidales bacterium]|nr:hypothetical protein [Dehalococcoidales bacterium]
MDAGIIITAVITVVVVVLGFILEKERDRKAKLHERKEDLYKHIVSSFKGLSIEKPDALLKQQFIDETRLTRLYASDEAIKALNELLDLMMKGEKNFEEVNGKSYQYVAHNLWGKFMIAMREDLGIKTKLSADELGRTEDTK